MELEAMVIPARGIRVWAVAAKEAAISIRKKKRFFMREGIKGVERGI
jgi:hypothetical protein